MGRSKVIKISKNYGKSTKFEEFWDDCGFNNIPFHYCDEQIVKHFMSKFNKSKEDFGHYKSHCTLRPERYVSETALNVLDRQPNFAYVLTLWEISLTPQSRSMDDSTAFVKSPPSLISSCVSKIPDFRKKNKHNKKEHLEREQCDIPKKTEFHDILQFWKKMEN